MSGQEQAQETDAATRRAQLEMCLPEWEDAETRAGNAWQAAQETEDAR